MLKYLPQLSEHFWTHYVDVVALYIRETIFRLSSYQLKELQ